MALPRLRFFWLSRTLSKHIQTACLNLAKIQKPERHSHSCWGICNRKKSLMPLLGVNMRSFVSASMIHIRRSSNASVPNAWHKNKTQKHQKLWESARSARYCAQHCPALLLPALEPSDVYKSSGLGAVLQLSVSVTSCHMVPRCFSSRAKRWNANSNSASQSSQPCLNIGWYHRQCQQAACWSRSRTKLQAQGWWWR